MADWHAASFLHASPKSYLHCLSHSWQTARTTASFPRPLSWISLTLPGRKASQCLRWDAAEPGCHSSLQSCWWTGLDPVTCFLLNGACSIWDLAKINGVVPSGSPGTPCWGGADAFTEIDLDDGFLPCFCLKVLHGWTSWFWNMLRIYCI